MIQISREIPLFLKTRIARYEGELKDLLSRYNSNWESGSLPVPGDFYICEQEEGQKKVLLGIAKVYSPETEYNIFMSAGGKDERYVEETFTRFISAIGIETTEADEEAKFSLDILTGTRRFG